MNLNFSIGQQAAKKTEAGIKKEIQIKLVKSLIGRKPNHLRSVKALGLKKINQEVCVLNNSCNRGLVNKVSYLLKIKMG